MIGVVGPNERAARLAGAIEGIEVRTGRPDDVLDPAPDVVAAIGERAVVDLVRSDVAVPVLPVETGEGLDAVSLDRAPDVLAGGLESGFRVRARPLLGVALDGEAVGRGLFDVMLVTTEPARISEYAVDTPGHADRFRADGVVVATPAGSRGYARAVGGPVLDSDAACLAVVPVAAFDVRPTVRVASVDATLSVRVEREEGGISLLVDGVDHGPVPPKRRVTVRVADHLETVVSPGG